jgi:hypothetical protein
MSTFFPGSNDIFRTQADTRFNSFAEPMNPVNMNPGNWGVDPNYLTPPYLSPFRPQYQGPSGPSYQSFRPSWRTSANQIFNPMAPGGDNYGGNYMQQQSPYFDKFLQGPMDGAASFAQNLAIPGAAAWAAYKYWGNASTKIGRSIGQGVMSGIFRGAGMTSGFGGEMATMGIRAGGFLGGMAGGIALPMLGTQGIVSAADKAIFDPYVSQRTMARDMRENFRGVTFGDGNFGDTVTGGGMSRRRAAQIASRVSQAGASDMTFNQQETSLLADYASRSGLMDNANTSQMSSRFEGILKQVKLVMSVANTSDFKETIEIMSKMQMAGAGSSNLAGIMGRLGAAAGAGGQSVQKLMNTVGAQGQYLFAAQGLTPYVGHEAAFNASASMSAAFRSGLVSPAMMARMGGVEGAAQSGVAGQIAAYSTPYASMQAYNRYVGGGAAGSVVGNVGRFGGAMAGNVLQNAGRLGLMRGALTSRSISDNGLFGEQQQIYELAKTLPNGLQANGKVDAGVAFQIMTQTMGMTPEMAQAKVAQFHTFNDPNSTNQMLSGSRRASIDSLLKYQQQEGLNKGFLTGTYNAVKRGLMKAQQVGAKGVGGALEDIAGLTDRLEGAWMRGMMGVDATSKDNQTVEFDDLGKTGDLQRFNLDQSNQVRSKGLRQGRDYDSTDVNTLNKINKLAEGGGEQGRKARAFIKETDPTKRAALLDELTQGDNGLDSRYLKSEGANKLIGLADAAGIVSANVTSGGQVKTLENTLGAALEKVLPGGNVANQLHYQNLMENVYNSKGKVDDETKAQIARLKGLDPSKMTPQQLREMADDYMKTSSESGSYVALGLEASSLSDLESQQKKRGGPALGASIKSGGDVGATKAQRDLQIGNVEYRRQIQQMVKEGKIDTQAAMGAINALDNKEAVSKFDKAVDKFVGKVDKEEESKGSGGWWDSSAVKAMRGIPG